ncbi:MAG: methionyl-tRNA formyltransferase [Dehalococcoidia bacterium]|nr:methionyl-tRNA formyltransferase [Dehalococcoidia bacterium]MDD5647967.1 methionyl-tRNA formyltransferase [Dehalococcoidia bacterium]
MKVVFMGSPAFALPALQALIFNKYDIKAVYTQPDKKTGRGQQVSACPVKQFAADAGLRVIQPESLRDTDEVELLAGLMPDIIIVAAYGQILPEAVLKIPQHKCINIHPSLLPLYRGPSPVAAAILNGDAQTGVSIMLIERKVDSGPIIAQTAVDIKDDDTTGSLTGRLAETGAGLLLDTLTAWVSGTIKPVAQNESRASYTRMWKKEDGTLDWNWTAVQLWRKVRAYNPWPGSYVKWMGSRIKIMETVPLADVEKGRVGQVVELTRGEVTRVAVCTGEGLLGLVRIQPEGKREMAAGDFVVGHRNFIGSLL